MKRSVKIIAFLLISVCLLPFFSPRTNAKVGIASVSAVGACLIEAESGKILYSKNESKKMPMASTTKIMTALVAIESGISLDRTVNIPDAAIGIEGSSIYMQNGERLTFGGLLYALLLSSANDASVAIAITVSGSVEAFVLKMNEKAATLGLSSTHFTNPHGLYDTEHYTTAHDLARLMAYCMQNSIFAEITASKKMTLPRGEDGVRVLINHNKLLNTYDGVIGGKTGFTKKSGRCLVSVAERDGMRLIAVTLNAPDDWNDHKKLYDFAFANYERVDLAQINLSLPVISGIKSTVNVSSGDACSCLLTKDSAKDIKCTLKLPRFLYADVKKGEQIGVAVYTLNGKILAQVGIFADEDVAREKYSFSFFEWLFSLFGA